MKTHKKNISSNMREQVTNVSKLEKKLSEKLHDIKIY